MSLKVGDLVEVTNRTYNTYASKGPIVDIDNANKMAPFIVRIAGLDMYFHPDDIKLADTTPDPVSRPPHYTAHPSGIECIQVTEHMSFLLGNTIKYIWRADLKQDAIEDLKKARWYLDREIQKRETA